jgi:hypothetical protein
MLVLMGLIVAVVISIQLGIVRKRAEDQFQNYFVDRCNKVLYSSRDSYYDDSKESNVDYRKDAEELYGKKFDDQDLEIQFEDKLVALVSGSNNSCAYGLWDEVIDDDKWLYFDKDMNRIVPESLPGALYYVRKNDEGKSVLYYSCESEKLIQKIEDLKQEYGENLEGVRFHVKGVYTLESYFIPALIEYSVTGSNKVTTIMDTESAEDELDMDGIVYHDIDTKFTYDSSGLGGDGDSVIYTDFHNDRTNEIMGMINDYKSHNPDAKEIYIEKQDKFYTVEFVSVKNWVPEEGGDEEYNAVTYQYINLLYEPTVKDMESHNIGGVLWGMIFAIEIAGALVLSILFSIIITVVGKKRNNNGNSSITEG